MTTLQLMIEKLITPVGAIGLFGNLMFTSRFLVQWIESEKRGESVIPFSFWIFSLLGGGSLLTYSILVAEPILFIGTFFNTVVYARNIVLLKRRESLYSQSVSASERERASHDSKPNSESE